MATTTIISAKVINLANSVNKGSFAYIKYESEEKCPKYLGLGKVTKVSCGNCQLNYDYQSAVNRRLAAEGKEANFNALSLPWGQWLVPNVLIDHKNELYLRFYCVQGQHFETSYKVDGRPATESEIAAIKAWKVSKATTSARQSDAGLDEHQVMPKNVKVSNIIELHCGEYGFSREEIEALAAAETQAAAQ